MYIRKRKRRRIILFLIMDSLLGPPCKWQLALYFMNPCAMQYCTAQNITCTVVHFAALHWREYHLHCTTLCCNALHKTWPALNCTEHKMQGNPALYCMHCFCPCLCCMPFCPVARIISQEETRTEQSIILFIYSGGMGEVLKNIPTRKRVYCLVCPIQSHGIGNI